MTSPFNFCRIFFLIVSSIIITVDGKVNIGSVSSTAQWQYLDKFCFDSSGGLIVSDFVLPSSFSSQTVIALYADIYSQWPAVYGANMDCQQKLSYAALTFPITSSEVQLIVIGARPRWWYFAVANCAGTGLSFGYNLTLTNAGGPFTHQFSFDEQTELEVAITFFIYYTLIIGSLVWAKRKAKRKGMQYSVHKILGFGLCLYQVGLLLEIAHRSKYSGDGIGLPMAEQLTNYFYFSGVLALLLLVLQISQGWPVSTNALPYRRINYLIILALFICYLSLYIYNSVAADPASVLYIFESDPGYAIIALNISICVLLFFFTLSTMKIESELKRRRFYLFFFIYSFIWLLSLPLIVLIAHFLDSWNRAKVVFGLTQTVHCLAVTAMYLFFVPFRSCRCVDILDPDQQRLGFAQQANMQVFPALPAIQFLDLAQGLQQQQLQMQLQNERLRQQQQHALSIGTGAGTTPDGRDRAASSGWDLTGKLDKGAGRIIADPNKTNRNVRASSSSSSSPVLNNSERNDANQNNNNNDANNNTDNNGNHNNSNNNFFESHAERQHEEHHDIVQVHDERDHEGFNQEGQEGQ